jgi:DNA polymerase I
MRHAAERVAQNTPMQGAGADLIKLAMLATSRRIAAEQWPARMLLTVHDELVFEVPNKHLKAASELVREGMEDAIELDVPLVASIASGPNWADAAPEGH